MPPFSHLQLVDRVDSWPYFTKDPEAYRRHMQDYHYFLIEGYNRPFEYVHNHFVTEVPWPDYWKIDPEKSFLTLTSTSNFETHSRLLNEILRKGHGSQRVLALLHWANEKFPLYSSTGEHVLNLDGCRVDMFDIVNYSIHLIA